jgi:hypothetical protein
MHLGANWLFNFVVLGIRVVFQKHLFMFHSVRDEMRGEGARPYSATGSSRVSSYLGACERTCGTD